MKVRRILTFYSAAHFLVDMGCAMLIYRITASQTGNAAYSTVFFSVIIYNFFAFVTELPAGLLLDRVAAKSKSPNGLIAAAGCMIIAFLDLIISNIPDKPILYLLIAVIAGLSNAAFHLGAGIDILELSERKASYSGIFISTGALGLFLGANAEALRFCSLAVTGIALLIMGLFLAFSAKNRVYRSHNSVHSGYSLRASALLAVFLLTLVIFYRSFLGFSTKYSWRSGFWIGLVATLSVVFGKMSGGIIADRFGMKRTILVSLILCAILAVFSDAAMIPGCIVLYLFNMTMPIAMIGLANLLPEWKGVAFGLNTTALFLGYVAYKLIDVPVSGYMLGILILVSALILLTALRIAPEMEEKNDQL
ncbi:MAG: hypothetical protein IJV16_02235 [Lachnospiraceae bacterium]|nr:hypothetical protein [Lachnospiraceae bacterium]